MGFKQTFTISLVIGSVINSQIHIYADKKMSKDLLERNLKEEIMNSNDVLKFGEISKLEEDYNDNSEVKDVIIEWLKDNTTIYRGSDIYIEGSAVTTGSTIQDIGWSYQDIEGQDIISLSKKGNKAIVKAKNTGSAEIMAFAIDGSKKSREIVVRVEDYPTDDFSLSLISDNITPVQSVSGVLQVEANKAADWAEDKVDAIDLYLKKLATLGMLSNKSISLNSMYEFHTINITGEKVNTQIEVRVDRKDFDSYNDIVSMLKNIEQYNQPPTEPEPPVDPEIPPTEPEPPVEPEIPPTEPEPPVEPEIPPTEPEPPVEPEIPPTEPEPPVEPEIPPTEPEPPVEPEIPPTEPELPKYIVKEGEITQGLEEIKIIGGFGEKDNPIKIEIDKNLSTEDKVDVMSKYLDMLKKYKYLQIINVRETKEYSAYTIKVTNKLLKYGLKSGNNDFYIEIIVDKKDNSYKEIIAMLDQIDKNKDNQVAPDVKLEKPTKPNNLNENNKNKLEKIEKDNKVNLSSNTQQNNTSKVSLTNENNLDKSKDKKDNYNKLQKEIIYEKEEIIEKEENKFILITVAGASIGGLMLCSGNRIVNSAWLIELFRRKR
ncbi:MAG: hypothetical protein ACRC3Y_13465 [Romboutsia sp.]|uniref:hypothetical protein n=1 Tax=Romboutsia sp. TaxID=1965302 RepID=UPI003F346BF1